MPQTRRRTVTTLPRMRPSGPNGMGLYSLLAGSRRTRSPLREKCLTVAPSSVPGTRAATMSPFWASSLRPDDHVVVLGDLGVDHRVAAHPQHEQGALPTSWRAGRSCRRPAPRPGSATRRGSHRPAAPGPSGTRRELDRPVLAGVAADQVQRLELVEPVADRPDGLDPDRLADLAHRRHQSRGRVRVPDEVVDLLAGRAQLAVRHQTTTPPARLRSGCPLRHLQCCTPEGADKGMPSPRRTGGVFHSREHEPHHGPLPGALSAVIWPPCASDQAPGDGQPEPGPARVGRLHEPVEHVREVAGVDPGPGVGHGEGDPARPGRPRPPPTRPAGCAGWRW